MPKPSDPLPVVVEIHYDNGAGYWAQINSVDAGVSDHDWGRFARSLGERLAAVNLIHEKETWGPPIG